MSPVSYRQSPSASIALRRIAERGLGAEGNARQVNHVLAIKTGNRSGKRRLIIENKRSTRAGKIYRSRVSGMKFDARVRRYRRRSPGRLSGWRWISRRRIVDDGAAGAIAYQFEVCQAVGSIEVQCGGVGPVGDREHSVTVVVSNGGETDVAQIDLIGARKGTITGEVENLAGECWCIGQKQSASRTLESHRCGVGRGELQGGSSPDGCRTWRHNCRRGHRH